MLKKNKSYFLKEVRQQWPNLFYFCCVFILGTLISGFIIGQTQFPFFIYQMYSQPIPEEMADSGSVCRIYINNEELNTFNLPRESGDIIRSNTERFIYLKSNNFKDRYFMKLKTTSIGKYLPQWIYSKILTIPKTSDQQYASWLKKYLQQLVKKPIKRITLYNSFYRYGKSNLPVIYRKQLIFSLSYE